jgi:hypothetical protein
MVREKVPTREYHSRRAERCVPLCLLLCGLLANSGCEMDSRRLAERVCGAGEACVDGAVCCRGYCLPRGACPDTGPDGLPPRADLRADIDLTVDRDGDGVRNEKDNCPDIYNPYQADADHDGVGDVCDCAPTDPAFKDTVIDLPTFPAPVPFTPVESGADWAHVGALYLQMSKDGVHRAVHTLADQLGFLASVQFRVTDKGDAKLTGTAQGVALAGVVVRTGSLGPGTGSGYYCAVDMAKSRLVLGKTKGDDLAKGIMSLLPSPTDPFGEAGLKITEGVTLQLPYRVTLRAEGTQLQCQAVLPDSSIVEFSETDADLQAGGVALFTAGAAASFETVKVCAHK